MYVPLGQTVVRDLKVNIPEKILSVGSRLGTTEHGGHPGKRARVLSNQAFRALPSCTTSTCQVQIKPPALRAKWHEMAWMAPTTLIHLDVTDD